MAMSFIGRSDLPLGLRNNNPGDFRTGIAWQGIVGDESGYLTFSDITYGCRALALDLINNIKKGVDTIRLFITKYAPPSENDTSGYIAFVSNQTGIGPDEQLGTDQDTIHSMMRAIIRKEIGDQNSLVTDAMIDQGISMATGGMLTTLTDALTIASQNPTAYIENASTTQWVEVVAGAAGIFALLYILAKK